MSVLGESDKAPASWNVKLRAHSSPTYWTFFKSKTEQTSNEHNEGIKTEAEKYLKIDNGVDKTEITLEIDNMKESEKSLKIDNGEDKTLEKDNMKKESEKSLKPDTNNKKNKTEKASNKKAEKGKEKRERKRRKYEKEKKNIAIKIHWNFFILKVSSIVQWINY